MPMHSRAMLPLAVLSLPIAMLAIPALAGTPAGKPSREIVVTGTPGESALARWAGRVQANLQSQMWAPEPMGAELDPMDRLAEVSFVRSDGGRPDRVALARSSGSGRYDLAALRAVRRIASIDPLPEGISADQPIRAQMLFINSTTDDGRIARRAKAMTKDAAERNAGLLQDRAKPGGTLVLAAVK